MSKNPDEQNNDNPDEQPNNNPENKSEITDPGSSMPKSNSNPAISESRMEAIFEEMQMMSLQRGNKRSFDLSIFNDKQRDEMIEIAKLNEKNSFAYHQKKLEKEERETKMRLEAQQVNQKTLRYIAFMTIGVISILLTLILFIKTEFFTQFLTVVTALMGGAGLTKFLDNTTKRNNNQSKSENEDQ